MVGDNAGSIGSIRGQRREDQLVSDNTRRDGRIGYWAIISATKTGSESKEKARWVAGW